MARRQSLDLAFCPRLSASSSGREMFMAPAAAPPPPAPSFRPRQQDVGAGKQAEVAVACDIQVFDWLLRHAKATHLGGRYEQPELTLELCLPVLAAAGYLQVWRHPPPPPHTHTTKTGLKKPLGDGMRAAEVSHRLHHRL